MSRTIAIVEDEPVIRENYADLFRRQGFRVAAFAERSGVAQELRRNPADLVILDIGLGDEYDAGFALCRELRAASQTLPIIFLTARDTDIDTVAGLRLGADDYVTKDVSLAQLSARVAALLRRADAGGQAASTDATIACGPLLLNPQSMQVRWRGQPVALTVTEHWMLHALVRHPGHVKSRAQLMEAAGTYVDLATITSHIKRMRRKFLALDPSFDAIEAVYGAGYRWAAKD